MEFELLQFTHIIKVQLTLKIILFLAKHKYTAHQDTTCVFPSSFLELNLDVLKTLTLKCRLMVTTHYLVETTLSF